MKTFSTLITEAITLPEFKHPDLNKPRDPEGKFWKAIDAANETGDKPSKNIYRKAIKLAKDLYAQLVELPEDEDIVDARYCASEAVKHIEKSAGDTVEAISVADERMLKQYVFLIKAIDNLLKNKPFYKKGHVDIKAGYVPFRGAAKDPKVKYRMVISYQGEIPAAAIKEINKDVATLNPLAADFICGIEFNKSKTQVQILFTNSQGYKR